MVTVRSGHGLLGERGVAIDGRLTAESRSSSLRHLDGHDQRSVSKCDGFRGAQTMRPRPSRTTSGQAGPFNCNWPNWIVVSFTPGASEPVGGATARARSSVSSSSIEPPWSHQRLRSRCRRNRLPPSSSAAPLRRGLALPHSDRRCWPGPQLRALMNLRVSLLRSVKIVAGQQDDLAVDDRRADPDTAIPARVVRAYCRRSRVGQSSNSTIRSVRTCSQ
jgi:hypothetical protein